MLPYEISPAEVAQLRTENKPFTLLDVREGWEVNTAAIPGTLNIPMGEVPSRANNALDPDSHIVVLCHHGMRSLSVTAWLRKQGFDQAQSLAGGIDQYAREIDPTIPLY
jgi:rhodanese-related sulfurtransferase